MSDTLSVIVHLPQPVDAVASLMSAVHDIWPDATLDVSGPWKIEVPASE